MAHIPLKHLDILLRQGITFSRVFTYQSVDPNTQDRTPIPLTDKVFVVRIKDALSSGHFVMRSDEAPTVNGSSVVVTNDLAGEWTLTITDEETETFSVKETRWSVKMENADGTVMHHLDGDCRIIAETDE